MIISLFLLTGCAGSRPPIHRAQPTPPAVDWTVQQVLVVEIASPVAFLRWTPALPLGIRITFLRREQWGAQPVFVPVEGAGHEGLWLDRVQFMLANNERIRQFIESGYIGIEPAGPGEGAHPLLQGCPGNLVTAVIASPVSRRLYRLDASTLVGTRDPNYGCIYRIRL